MLSGYAVLRNRNYRVFWLGQWVSLIGTWMQTVTQAWMLRHDPFALGLLGAATAAPMLLFVAFGGALSDRLRRRNVIMVTQALSLLQALVLAGLTYSGQIATWHIIGLAALLGAINAFDVPARQSFVIELVGRGALPNALALNATGFNAARVIGPAIGGVLVATLGEATCFLLNAVSYLAVLMGLWSIPLAALGGDPPRPSHDERVWAGVRYATGDPELWRVLVLVGVVSGVNLPYRNFLPAMAEAVLKVDASHYGVLSAAAGFGAGLGALILAGVRLAPRQYRRLLPAGLLTFAVALAAFSATRTFGLSVALLTVAGLGGIAYFNASNVLVQLRVDDAYRGRVMGLYALMHQGTATFGSLLLGAVAARFGTPSALLSGAVVCAAATLWFVAGRAAANRADRAAPAS